MKLNSNSNVVANKNYGISPPMSSFATKQVYMTATSLSSWKVSIAPMVNYSTRQMRHIWRLLCSDCLLYTEMLPVKSMLHGNRERLLDYSEYEKPLALQVAGNSPLELAEAAHLAKEWGYDEINLNTGCPSCKLTQAGMGACMIKEPKLTAECIAAMKSVAGIPVTLKTRLGVDDWDDDEKLHCFIREVKSAGLDRVIIHARKAWLNGLSPSQNRSIPPLNFGRVERISKAFPELPIIINGGIDSIAEINSALKRFDGVMIGRAAYNNPLILKKIAEEFFATDKTKVNMDDLVKMQLSYAQKRWQEGEPFRYSGIHLLNLYNGKSGARLYRREMSRLLRRKNPPSINEVRAFLPHYN